ncbi:MAG TPA: diguanylate cyclase [Vicinamibacteria bacterium]
MVSCRRRCVLPIGLLGAVLASAGPAQAQRLNFHNYTSLDGLPQRQVLAVFQDSTGYLWFGTYGGVSRYNGAEFRTFEVHDGLSSNTVTDLAEDGQGRLVVGTQRGLCFRQDAGFHCLRAGPQLANDAVRDVERDADGSIWAATEGGLTHLVAGRPAVHYTTAAGLPAADCYKVRRDGQGVLWVGTAAGLARLDGERFTSVAPEVLGRRAVPVVLPYAGGLVVGTDAGAFQLQAGTLRAFGDTPSPGTGEGERAYFTDAAQDANGTVWLSTRSGVLRFDGTSLVRLTVREGLLADSVHKIWVDRENNVWFGSEGGASKLVPGPFVTYSTAEGLPHSFVRALGQDDRDRLWVGTRAGVALLDGGRFSTITTRDGLVSDRIYGFAQVKEGMLIGTLKGLVLWDGRVRRVYGVADGLPYEYVTSLLPDGQGGAWVGTSRGLARWRDGRLSEVAAEPLGSAAYILAMRQDGQGRLWLGLRAGGVVVVEGDRIERRGSAAGLSDETIWSIDVDGQGRVWIGSNGDGAFLVDGPRVRRLTTREGLVNDFVWQVLCDSQGAVWLYTNRGLDRWDGSAFRHYGRGDGLVDLEGSAGAAWRMPSGELWFGSGTGLSRYLPARDVANAVPPVVVVEEATAGGSAPLPADARLAYGLGTLAFRFAGLSFRDEAEVRFRYRLRGVSDAWSLPTSEHRIAYGHLPPGAYEFQVMASNDDGVWSAAPARFALTVRPPWWQSWPARLAGILVALGLVASGYAWRVRRVDAERARLERLVAERTAELAARNAQLREIAILDDLTQVGNRRHFLEALDLEVKRASRVPGGGSLGLFLLDVDHFKRVNDSYGHPVGDQLLTALARRLTRCVRSTDLVARYGGEEFAVLLPLASREGTELLARRVHDALGGTPFELEGLEVSVTVSIGVVHVEGLVDPAQATPARLIRDADSALYQAKQDGRNRVVVAAESLGAQRAS